MSSIDPLRVPARIARRVPGYPMARRMLLPRLRNSVMLRAVAHRLWVTEVAPDGRGAELTSGKLLAGVGLHTLPVLLVVLSEVPEEMLESVVDEIAQIQVLTAGFRPVLLLNGPVFEPARKYGYAAEVAPAAMNDVDQIRYWQRLRRTYGSSLICDVPGSGLSERQRAFLLSLAPEL